MDNKEMEKLDLEELDQVAGGIDTEEIMAKIGSTFGTVTDKLAGAKEKLGRVADLFSATINGYATAAMGNPLGALGETCREMGVLSKGIDTIKASQGAIEQAGEAIIKKVKE